LLPAGVDEEREEGDELFDDGDVGRGDPNLRLGVRDLFDADENFHLINPSRSPEKSETPLPIEGGDPLISLMGEGLKFYSLQRKDLIRVVNDRIL